MTWIGLPGAWLMTGMASIHQGQYRSDCSSDCSRPRHEMSGPLQAVRCLAGRLGTCPTVPGVYPLSRGRSFSGPRRARRTDEASVLLWQEVVPSGPQRPQRANTTLPKVTRRNARRSGRPQAGGRNFTSRQERPGFSRQRPRGLPPGRTEARPLLTTAGREGTRRRAQPVSDPPRS